MPHCGILQTMLKRFLKAVADFLFPPRCVMCGELLASGEEVLCEGCRMAYLSAANETCHICGRKYCRCLCSTEDLRNFRVSRLFKLFRYQKEQNGIKRPVNQIIFHMKRERDFPCRDFLAQEIVAAVNAEMPEICENPSWVLAFAPRSRARKIQLGHDQSEILGKKIAKLLGIEFYSVLKRSRKTKQQKKFARRERFENMKNAYTVAKADKIRGKRVLLVDDVVTTGASLGNAAKAIYKARAKEVVGIAIAVKE